MVWKASSVLSATPSSRRSSRSPARKAETLTWSFFSSSDTPSRRSSARRKDSVSATYSLSLSRMKLPSAERMRFNSSATVRTERLSSVTPPFISNQEPRLVRLNSKLSKESGECRTTTVSPSGHSSTASFGCARTASRNSSVSRSGAFQSVSSSRTSSSVARASSIVCQFFASAFRSRTTCRALPCTLKATVSSPRPGRHTSLSFASGRTNAEMRKRSPCGRTRKVTRASPFFFSSFVDCFKRSESTGVRLERPSRYFVRRAFASVGKRISLPCVAERISRSSLEGRTTTIAPSGRFCTSQRYLRSKSSERFECTAYPPSSCVTKRLKGSSTTSRRRSGSAASKTRSQPMSSIKALVGLIAQRFFLSPGW